MDPVGRVVSPNYPANYPARSNCNYTIEAGEQTLVVLTFQVFQIEGKFNHWQYMYRSFGLSLFWRF